MGQPRHRRPQPRDIEENAGLEERLARLEGRVEELSKRVDDLRSDMNIRFSELRNDINHLRSDIRRLEDRLESRFKWFMGILITMWTTIIATLITIVLTVL